SQAYDLVLCNPPYVPAASMRALPEEYRHEPEMALAGGADGMDLVRRFLHDAPAHLSARGIVVLEVGNERAAFEAAFPTLPAIWLETELHAEGVCVLTADDLRLAFAPGAGA
ncbi:MAG: ribosomal protein L3 N(5)-glutamine methyltransferase, partial [Thiomonas sp. 14-64-326]